MIQKAATVLLVDDEALVRHSLEPGLRLNGYEVLHAGDGDEALDVLSSESVDVAVIDLAMPGREGIETIIEIRRRFPDVKVIALSGVFGGFYLGMARHLGAAAALSKPVRTELLCRIVNDVLGACSA